MGYAGGDYTGYSSGHIRNDKDYSLKDLALCKKRFWISYRTRGSITVLCNTSSEFWVSLNNMDVHLLCFIVSPLFWFNGGSQVDTISEPCRAIEAGYRKATNGRSLTNFMKFQKLGHAGCSNAGFVLITLLPLYVRLKRTVF